VSEQGQTLRHLGSAGPTPVPQRPDKAVLDCFVNPNPDRLWLVGLDCYEFTSLCPVTGQPDFGRIHIHYVPDHFCVESKSLKLYLGAYRNHGAFHEECVNQIATDLFDSIDPLVLRVFGDFRVRGGIAIRPLVLLRRPSLHEEVALRAETMLAHHDRLVGGPVQPG
jgi:7-cyano-7-deazaguanine reductase